MTDFDKLITAGDAYYSGATDLPENLKCKLSFENLRDIFDKMVKPALKAYTNHEIEISDNSKEKVHMESYMFGYKKALSDQKKFNKMMGENNGFVQGQAWACAAMLRYEFSPQELIAQAGLTEEALKEAKVESNDSQPIIQYLRSKQK